MSVLAEQFEKMNITISLQYYGLKDLATGWEIKSIVENPEVFDDFCLKNPLYELCTIDDYYLYLLLLKLKKIEEVIPNLLREEDKKTITILIESVKCNLKIIKNGEVIKFINSHFEEIFSKDSDPDMKLVTLDLIQKFLSGISNEVIEYISVFFSYLILDRYKDYEMVYENNPDIFDLLVPTRMSGDALSYRYETVLDIFKYIMLKGKTNLKIIVENKIDGLFLEMKEISDKISDENVMRNEHYIRKFNGFLHEIKSPKANLFEVYNQKVSSKLDEYVRTKGQSTKYEIPVGKIISKWKEQKNWEMRILSLTHNTKIKDGQCIAESRLNEYKKVESVFADLCSTNIPTDCYYTYSHQQMLQINESVGTGTFMGIVHDDSSFEDYMNLVSSAIKHIYDSIEGKNTGIFEDVDMLFQSLGMINQCAHLDENIVKPLCYSAAMLSCAISEKLLLDTYEYLLRGREFVLRDAFTLTQLLKVSKSNPLINVFGENHLKHLSFFLSVDGERRIGYNYRNSLAHLSHEIEQRVSIQLVGTTLWLLTDILNTIFWYFLDRYLKGDVSEDQL